MTRLEVGGERGGAGVYKWPDGSMYDGEWKDGKPHGRGAVGAGRGGGMGGRDWRGAGRDWGM